MTQLYLVFMRDPAPDVGVGGSAVELDRGLFLVRTSQSRSQLYHAIKRRLAPRRLLVAPLTELPKFKGMKPGAGREAKALASSSSSRTKTGTLGALTCWEERQRGTASNGSTQSG